MESNYLKDYRVLLIAYEKTYGRLDSRHDLYKSLAHWRSFLDSVGVQQEGLIEFRVFDSKKYLLAKLKYGI